MTVSEIKHQLIQIRLIQQQYKLAADKARQFDELISAPKGTSFGGENVPAASRGNATEDKYLLALSYHEKVRALEAEMLLTRARAERFISVLEMQSEKEVITRRYIMCQTWERTADDMNYSVKQVCRIHNKALKKMSLNVKPDMC